MLFELEDKCVSKYVKSNTPKKKTTKSGFLTNIKVVL